MPSPFPGMDPYLENPLRWSGVHSKLINAAQEALVAELRPRYIVNIEERVYVSSEEDPVLARKVPDIHIVSGRLNAPRTKRPEMESGVSSAAVAEPINTITLFDMEVIERYLDIEDVTDHRVVTTIEFLSPANKTSNSSGRDSYLKKRNLIMRSDVHFVEIDLLRNGDQIPTGNGRMNCDYMAHVSRVWKRPNAQIWPIMLRERLPVIPIPLKKGDTDASLDLQKLLNLIYDRGGYDYKLDYHKDPVPKLSRTDAAWAAKILKATRATGKKKG